MEIKSKTAESKIVKNKQKFYEQPLRFRPSLRCIRINWNCNQKLFINSIINIYINMKWKKVENLQIASSLLTCYCSHTYFLACRGSWRWSTYPLDVFKIWFWLDEWFQFIILVAHVHPLVLHDVLWGQQHVTAFPLPPNQGFLNVK